MTVSSQQTSSSHTPDSSHTGVSTDGRSNVDTKSLPEPPPTLFRLPDRNRSQPHPAADQTSADPTSGDQISGDQPVETPKGVDPAATARSTAEAVDAGLETQSFEGGLADPIASGGEASKTEANRSIESGESVLPERTLSDDADLAPAGSQKKTDATTSGGDPASGDPPSGDPTSGDSEACSMHSPPLAEQPSPEQSRPEHTGAEHTGADPADNGPADNEPADNGLAGAGLADNGLADGAKDASPVDRASDTSPTAPTRGDGGKSTESPHRSSNEKRSKLPPGLPRDVPTGRSWMETLGSHGVVVVLLLVVVIAALIAGRDPSLDPNDASMALHGDSLEIQTGEEIDLPLPIHHAEHLAPKATSQSSIGGSNRRSDQVGSTGAATAAAALASRPTDSQPRQSHSADRGSMVNSDLTAQNPSEPILDVTPKSPSPGTVHGAFAAARSDQLSTGQDTTPAITASNRIQNASADSRSQEQIDQSTSAPEQAVASQTTPTLPDAIPGPQRVYTNTPASILSHLLPNIPDDESRSANGSEFSQSITP